MVELALNRRMLRMRGFSQVASRRQTRPITHKKPAYPRFAELVHAASKNDEV